MKSLKDMPQEYQFIDLVNQFMVLGGISATKLAKQSGIAASTLSQFLAQKYPGDLAAITAKLQAVMDRETEKSKLKKANPNFIETSISRRFFDIAKQTHLFGEIGVCYSDAGLGKTESAREYAALNVDAILIEALPSTTAGVFLRDLHSRLFNDSRKTINGTFLECKDRLKGSGRLLIIDEAEKLQYLALEYVRRIHDMAGIGILLCGMPELLGNIKGFHGQYAQIYSRVGLAIKLDKMSEKDVEIFVSMMAPGAEGLSKIFHSESAGNTRRLCKIISRAIHIADINDIPIDTEVILKAAKLVRVEVMS